MKLHAVLESIFRRFHIVREIEARAFASGRVACEERFKDYYKAAWAEGYKFRTKELEDELDRMARERNK